jgi:hypothetical protein
MPPNLGLLGGAAAVMLLLVAGVVALLMGQLKKSAGEGATGTPPAGEDVPAVTSPATGAEPGTAATKTPSQTTGQPVQAAPEHATQAAPTPAPPRPKPAAAAATTQSARSGPGTVRLMTRPFQPSTFFIDGDPYAFDVGFLSTQLLAGDHVVRVEGIAGDAVDVSVHVEPGGSYSLVAEFPNGGTLGSIEISLSGASRAQVLVDGAQYPETAPCTIRGLAPGPHSIKVVRAKSAPATGPAEVVVSAGGTARAEYRFGAGR